MFGYVTPCKMELKIKDFEKFKAYYCGLCKSIKKHYGNLPRITLNYDMTFLAILLDSLEDNKCSFETQSCYVHPLKKRLVIIDNKALDYSACCNITLSYFKLLDNIQDDNSFSSKMISLFLKRYMHSNDESINTTRLYIEKNLKKLSDIEAWNLEASLDEISHPFADLTGYIISSYADTKLYIDNKDIIKKNLYWLGYNLGKWIYIIDAWDDLKKDMTKKKFNPLNKLFNKDNEPYDNFKSKIEQRIDFTLVTCASQCVDCLNLLPLKKNIELLNNILQYGLMEKMDIVFKRSEIEDAKSI